MSILSQVHARNVLVEEFDIFDQKYQEKETTFDEDPLVLSCSLKDLAEKDAGSYYALGGNEARLNITQDIRDHAEAIRKYYTKKFFWTNLTNHTALSGFRSRVCFLLENRISKLKDQDQGIYFKLPWFYDEDMIYDEFKKTLKVDQADQRPLENTRKLPVTKRLQFLKSSFGWQRKRKTTRFWFKDEDNFLYGIELETTNPLLDMFEQIIKDNPTPLIETRLVEDRIDKLHFYKIYGFKFLKESNA